MTAVAIALEEKLLAETDAIELHRLLTTAWCEVGPAAQMKEHVGTVARQLHGEAYGGGEVCNLVSG